ncbi:hypothetical protein L6164_037397 [Bauhinia variegata]|uniref:Uncharacterized protein n=1 Tax=Bauhinia variegata TaxID=167791 RepID=A0ACB9KJW1_BAUVA|nr:hypothetical protein L6164_037397 [Bauhinia variegata]
MATFRNSLLIMVFLLASSTLLASTLSQENPSKPSSDVKHLLKCGGRLKQYGYDVGLALISGDFAAISDECCDELINRLGESCHFDLVYALSNDSRFRKIATKILERGITIWERCTSIAG